MKMRYPIELRDRMYVKGYGFLLLAKILVHMKQNC